VLGVRLAQQRRILAIVVASPQRVHADEAGVPAGAEDRVEHVLAVIGITRPGGHIGRVGVPQEETLPSSQPPFFGNVHIGGGPAPARAYIEELLPDILEGRIEPGKVFDRTVGLGEVPEGYRAMADRESIKVMVRP
jgi:threonine dehydrogenase-like Zn-dependent dehydrogenase